MIMNSIPSDLIHEISSRLPIKSIGRFRCVSKLWRPILCCPDFTELFLTRSSARPRLLFVMKGFGSSEWLFFSSPQAHLQCEKSSLAADFHLKLRGDMRVDFCGRASGLFCFHQEKGEDRVHVICNPSTGQYGFLPKLSTKSTSRSFLGFDPIDKIFKVVSMSSCDHAGHRILSLGTGIMSWRKIQCPLTHNPWLSQGICINGVLYYRAQHIDDHSYLIVCFYVRSEQFKFVHAGFVDGFRYPELINYKGRLGMICWLQTGGRLTHELRMWVLEDAEKQDWSEYTYTLPETFPGDRGYSVSAVGVTDTGEIVILKNYIHSRSEHVFYFHPERNTIQRVEVQCFDNHRGRVYAFVDHVDDLTFPMKPQQQQDRLPVESSNKFDRFDSINKFDALCLLDDV